MKRPNNHILLIVALALGLIAAMVAAQPPIWNTGTIEEQVQRLNDIQPGLGTVMIEYSTRFTNMYYAAKGGNWGLAAYQLKEALEIQEVGETTRPARADALKTFETDFLTPVSDAIVAQDFKQFSTAFKAAADGCNACHAAQGFPFIQYVLPRAPLMPLSTKPQKPPTLDGAVLYATYCAGCHGPLATSTKRGKTAAEISAAIGSVPAMSGLSSLTKEQIAAIASALH